MSLDFLRHDLRYAWRTLARDRAFALAAVAILTLGIAANTAMFSLVDSVLLRPLPYHDPDRLVAVYEDIPAVHNIADRLPANGRHYTEWKRNWSSVEDVALMDGRQSNLAGDGDPERVDAQKVSPNYFDVLGVKARLGRTFLPADAKSPDSRVAVISDSLWRRRYHADPGILSRTITVDARQYIVAGVLPPDFQTPVVDVIGQPQHVKPEIFFAWCIRAEDWDWAGDHNFASFARLKPGVELSRAAAEFNVVQSAIATHFDPVEKMELKGLLVPLQDETVTKARSGLWLLLGAVFAVLLIACVNLGNMMLIRATGRAHESSVRAALGASRWQIASGVLVESALLAGLGGVLGIGVAAAVLRILTTRAGINLPRLDEVHLDWRAAAVTFLLVLAAALVCGLAPALRLMRAGAVESLRAASRTTESGGKARIRQALVSLEVGLSVTLLIVAGLMIVSFVRLTGVDRGFEIERILTAEITLPQLRYPDQPDREKFVRSLMADLESQTGVVSAGINTALPLTRDSWADVVTLPGDNRPIFERPIVNYSPVTPHYWKSMGIPILSGRAFEESDRPRKVALVSEILARRLWPGENPIGKKFRRGNPKDEPFEVVGVTGDVRNSSLDAPSKGMVYVTYWERTQNSFALVVRTTADPRGAAGIVRRAVWNLDSQIPVSSLRTMEQVAAHSVAQRRFFLLLVVGFAIAALVLAVLGTYGVLSYAVARRTHEMGIRLALGAQPGQVISMVMRQGLTPVLIGILGGALGALALGRVIASILFGVKPQDPATILTVLLLTLTCSAVACWIPARRAVAVNPVDALRAE